MLYKDKTGKTVKITKGTRFFARDRLGRVFEYIDTGKRYGYEKVLINLTDSTETRAPKSWFSERYIETTMLYKGYEIDTTTYKNLITVLYCGDEVVFDTVDAAQQFIDNITKEDVTR